MTTKRTIRRLTAAALATAALASFNASAHAYCTVGDANIPGVPQYTFDLGNQPVPVYVVSNDATLFGHSTSQVGRAVGRSIDAINRYGMSEYTLRYGGTMNVLQAFFHNGPGIYIRAHSDCGACGGAAGCMTTPSVNANGNIFKANIQLVYNQTSCPGFDWQFYPDYANCAPGACADDMQATITHELLHAAGLAHSGSGGQCGAADNGSEGVMNFVGGTQYSEQRYLSRDDVEGLTSLYGRRVGTVDYHYSFDSGLNWGNGGLLGASQTHSALSSVSTATEGEDEIFFAYHANSGSYRPYSRSMTAAAANTLDAIGNLTVFHPQPVAYGDGTLVAARFTHESRTNNSKKLRWAWSTDDGNSWSGADAIYSGVNPVRTRRNGLAVAYDPKTAQFIAAYVGDDNAPDGNTIKCDDTVHGIMCDELRVTTLDPVTGEQHHTSLGVRTATAPSIACGDTTSWRNCIVSWVSTTANACVHWGHGRILNDGSFELYNDKSTGCLSGFSAPVLTYDDNEPATPWRMALTQEVVGNDNRIYTFRKGSSYAAGWTDQRSFAVTNNFRILGGLGFMQRVGGDKHQVMYLRK